MFNAVGNQIEMGYTISEFSSVLHGNFSAQQSDYKCHDISHNRWLISHAQSELKNEITVQQKPPRTLGLLTLPVLEVRFNLLSGNSYDEQQFFEKFYKYFHKGGG